MEYSSNIMNSIYIKKIIVIIFFLIPSIIYSTSVLDLNEYFLKGNSAYEKADFKLAIEKYNEIIDLGYESGEIYYNLGNSYYKNNDIINAIVSYERALKYIPNNENLIDNLDIANLSIVDRADDDELLPLINFIEKFENKYNIFSIRNTFIIFSFLLTFMISISILISNARIKKILNILNFLILFNLLMILFLFNSILNKNDIRYGIVSVDKISIMSSPDVNINNTTLFSLHKGTKIQVKSETDEWFEISISSEKKGWLKKDAVIEI